jgi:Zn-dependent protease with chaperone function
MRREANSRLIGGGAASAVDIGSDRAVGQCSSGAARVKLLAMHPAQPAPRRGAAARAARVGALALAIALTGCSAGAEDDAERRAREAMAQDEGIAVPRRSIAAGLASSEALERRAQAEYAQLLRQASAQRALGPGGHPTLARLQTIANRLIPHTRRFSDRAEGWRWEVNLIGSRQVNAFVMPGGKIVFYSAIIERLQLTDDEIAMIMGHEMAHALLEHGRERAGKTMIAQVGTLVASVVSQVLGYGDLGGQLASGAAQLTLLTFSRGDESEADLVGMDIAARAGFDPRAAVSLWRKMAEAARGQPPEFLSTHPSHATRIDTLSAALPKVLPLYARATGQRLESLPPYRSSAGPPVR